MGNMDSPSWWLTSEGKTKYEQLKVAISNYDSTLSGLYGRRNSIQSAINSHNSTISSINSKWNSWKSWFVNRYAWGIPYHERGQFGDCLSRYTGGWPSDSFVACVFPGDNDARANAQAALPGLYRDLSYTNDDIRSTESARSNVVNYYNIGTSAYEAEQRRIEAERKRLEEIVSVALKKKADEEQEMIQSTKELNTLTELANRPAPKLPPTIKPNMEGNDPEFDSTLNSMEYLLIHNPRYYTRIDPNWRQVMGLVNIPEDAINWDYMVNNPLYKIDTRIRVYDNRLLIAAQIMMSEYKITYRRYSDVKKELKDGRVLAANNKDQKLLADIDSEIKRIESEQANILNQVISYGDNATPWEMDKTWLPSEYSPDTIIGRDHFEYMHASKVLNMPSNELEAKFPQTLTLFRPSKETLEMVPDELAYQIFDSPDLMWSEAFIQEYRKLPNILKNALLYRYYASIGYISARFHIAMSKVFKSMNETIAGVRDRISRSLETVKEIAKIVSPILEAIKAAAIVAVVAAAVVVTGGIALGTAPTSVGAAFSATSGVVSSAAGAISGAIGAVAGGVGALAGGALGTVAGATIGAAATTVITKVATKIGIDALTSAAESVLGSNPVTEAIFAVTKAMTSGTIPNIPSVEDVTKVVSEVVSPENLKNAVANLPEEIKKKIVSETESNARKIAIEEVSKATGVPASALSDVLDGKTPKINVDDEIKSLVENSTEKSTQVSLSLLQKSTGIQTGVKSPFIGQADILKQVPAAELESKGFAQADVQAELSNSAKALETKIAAYPDTKLSKEQRQKIAEEVASIEGKRLSDAEAIKSEALKVERLAKAEADAVSRQVRLLEDRLKNASVEVRGELEKKLLSMRKDLLILLTKLAQASAHSKEATSDAIRTKLVGALRVSAAGQGRYNAKMGGMDYSHAFIQVGYIKRRIV